MRVPNITLTVLVATCTFFGLHVLARQHRHSCHRCQHGKHRHSDKWYWYDLK